MFFRLLFFTLFLNWPATILSCRPAFHFAREILAVRAELKTSTFPLLCDERYLGADVNFFVTGELNLRNFKDPFNFQRCSYCLLSPFERYNNK